MWPIAAHAQDGWRAPASATGRSNPIPPTRESLASGQRAFARHCSACHEGGEEGGGAAAAALEAEAIDFSKTDLSSQTDGELFWKVTMGRKPMPAFQRKLDDEARWNLINYIKSLSPRPVRTVPPRATPTKAKP
ncbi:MAG: cytochrome c [Planctomycetes bacterium]|nr:cytochrome c [Planctomycetota bacterium]